ncbi:MAG TPA: carbohydrate ABC transporter permease [Candidatus Faecimorpha stercoravium]|nr:carbohydrate ABC transporter permease [Candidatus Faecimorpha stercoravium]
MNTRIKEKTFDVCNYILMTVIVIICLIPFVYVISLSLSSTRAVLSREVFFWPVEFDLVSYENVVSDPTIMPALWMSVKTTVLHTLIAMVLTILTAYPLSQKRLRGHRAIMMIILFTMFFNGGIIPDYLLVNSLGLTNNMWGIIIPCGINTFNVIILRTFFLNSIPAGLQEAAQIDGCNDFMILVRIVLPLSKPVLATLALFYAVARWNGFQDAKFYINKQELYTLPQKINMIINSSQLSSQTMMNNPQLAEQRTAEEGIKAASIVFTTLPILLVYPWLQKYFVHGVMIGAIKE